MKLDAVLVDGDGTRARELEELGYDGVWTAEIQHDPYLPLAVAAPTTERVTLGTAIATAFTRSPMVTAMAAWDLQRASAGRFVLGLGTQVKAHNERRFSVPSDSPAARLRELVEALRHIWGAFAGEHRLSFRGRFYRHDLLTPFFDPGPIALPRPPIYLAAVTPTMYRLVGEVADGVHVHPFHTVRYLREVALPSLGARRPELVLACSAFVVLPGMEQEVRRQVAFYGSTRTYSPVLEVHGHEDLATRLHRLMARGDPERMAAAIPDDLLAEFAVFGATWEEAVARLRDRYTGLLDRIAVYGGGDVEAVARAHAEAAGRP